MNYKSLIIWVYCLLMIMFFMLTFSSKTWVLMLSLIGIPVLIIFQVISILRSGEHSEKTFERDWYDYR